MKTVVVIAAAGSGKRLKSKVPKPFVKIGGVPLIAHTLAAFQDAPAIDGIILVSAREFIEDFRKIAKKYGISKLENVVAGGDIRARSVQNGIQNAKDADIILVHDGGRPCVSRGIIGDSVKAAKKYGAACVCVPVKPTLKFIRGKTILKTLDRSCVYEAQTPQAFKRKVIDDAYRNSSWLKDATDDAGLAERAGYKVRIVPGSYTNIKVTTEEDLLLASQLLKR